MFSHRARVHLGPHALPYFNNSSTQKKKKTDKDYKDVEGGDKYRMGDFDSDVQNEQSGICAWLRCSLCGSHVSMAAWVADTECMGCMERTIFAKYMGLRLNLYFILFIYVVCGSPGVSGMH